MKHELKHSKNLANIGLYPKMGVGGILCKKPHVSANY